MKPRALPRCKVDPWQGIYPQPSRLAQAARSAFLCTFVLIIPCFAAVELVVLQRLQSDSIEAVMQVQTLKKQIATFEAFDPNKACLGWWFGGGSTIKDAKNRLCSTTNGK